MGRALFSEKYGSKAPAIRVQPESVTPDPARWSISNPFDPDSDEFFQGAEYEAFMDMGETAATAAATAPFEDTSQPVRMTAIWDRLVDESGGGATYTPVVDEVSGEISYARTDTDDGVTIRATADSDRPRPVVVLGASPIHPPSSLRNSTTATDLERANATPSPRRVSVPPISIPVEPSSPSPASPTSASPTTPPAVYSTHMQLMTPSPAPTVTPRIYVWGSRTHPSASPGSPSVRHTYSHSAGPLTNPGARQSLARITPRRRAQNV
ncbi:putative proline-rich protein [Mycena venus]|uniref:Putative proline-rich protein n=1 Tax=Mycena venus TaxID=2733690 RepID=A0A8H7D2B3_9AGAR|nr:putative proline-rich protein [Mycena venus]